MRELNIKRAILAFIITIVVFVIIFSITYSVSYFEYQRISQQQENIIYEITSESVLHELNDNLCENFSLNKLNERLDNMGSIIGILEDRFGKTDSRVIDKKQIYSVLEAQHYLQIKEYKTTCNKNLTTILFFYSNKKDFMSEADKDGFILSSLKTENPENVFVYSFDYDLNIPIINKLKEKYSINRPNSIIINENDLFVKLSNIDDLKKYI